VRLGGGGGRDGLFGRGGVLLGLPGFKLGAPLGGLRVGGGLGISRLGAGGGLGISRLGISGGLEVSGGLGISGLGISGLVRAGRRFLE
jgi:hypothetical protein